MNEDNIYTPIREKIKALRRCKGLTQEQLAEIANISEYYLGEIERGEKKPTIYTLAKVAQALEMKLYELLMDLDI